MFSLRLTLTTVLAMLAFAANSVLCRLALKSEELDAATFTTVRLVSGAIMLWLIVVLRRAPSVARGSWRSGAAIFVYAAPFSFAYTTMPAGIGTLLLFGSVQTTMIVAGIWRGERLRFWQSVGLTMALCGLVYLVLPSVVSPPLVGSLLMMTAGFAWGVYSLWGRGSVDPIAITAGNFVRAVPFSIALSLCLLPWMKYDSRGLLLAVVSGAVTSGLGYVIWYAALRELSAITAATVQLSVPVLAALAGVVCLRETITTRTTIASITILGGIAMVVWNRVRPA